MCKSILTAQEQNQAIAKNNDLKRFGGFMLGSICASWNNRKHCQFYCWLNSYIRVCIHCFKLDYLFACLLDMYSCLSCKNDSGLRRLKKKHENKEFKKVRRIK